MKPREFWLSNIGSGGSFQIIPPLDDFVPFSQNDETIRIKVREVLPTDKDWEKQFYQEMEISKRTYASLAIAQEGMAEAVDILESVAASGGFSIPVRAKEWLKKYGDFK